MKKFLILLLVLSTGLLFGDTLTKDLSYSISNTSGLTGISAEFINGKGVIKGVKGNKLKVKVKVKIKSDDQSACQEVYKKVSLKVKKSDDEVELSLNYDDLKKYLHNEVSFFNFFCSNGKRVDLSVNVEITVPSGFSVEFSGVNFDINAEGLKKVDISSVNGNIDVRNTGKVECETVNGNVLLKNIFYKVDCEVVNGNLTLDTDSEKISSISFESVNGNAHIKLPGRVIGSIDTDSLTSKTTFVFKGKKTVARNLEWEGEGNCDIDVETVNGKIVIEGF